MREILFKAKEVDSGEWVEGYLVRIDEETCFIASEYDILAAYTDNRGTYDGWMSAIDPETICQYTGLTDKNGNKIWENDVVRYEDDLSNMLKEDLIVWNETHAAFTRLHKSKMGLQYLYIDEFIASNSEVIGNIFDNPELLKAGV